MVVILEIELTEYVKAHKNQCILFLIINFYSFEVNKQEARAQLLNLEKQKEDAKNYII